MIGTEWLIGGMVVSLAGMWLSYYLHGHRSDYSGNSE